MKGKDTEEEDDIKAEEEIWREWDGKTECFGLVAKAILLCLIVFKAIVETL